MTPIFYHNWRNGFSGGIIYDSYYYGLFGVTMTNLALMIYMLFDTEVDYNYNDYLKELVPADQEKQKKYDPTKFKWTDLKYTPKHQYLEERGISQNSDGSTNNLPEYFWYCRECYSSKMDYYFGYFYCLAYIGGALLYYISFGTLHSVIGVQGGVVNDHWNSGLGIFATLIYVYHFYTIIELRSYSCPIIFGWIFSVLMFMPVCINWANGSEGGAYYMN